jgi:phage terminase large subunit-like protein
MNKTNNDIIKERLKQEIIKCKNDYLYLMINYFYIVHPTKGKIKFDLFDFQSKTLNTFFNENKIIILKGRQLGLSTLSAAYITYKLLFERDYSALVIATKEGTAQNLVKKVKVMYNMLPSFLKLYKKTKENTTNLTLSNGSSITAVSSNSDSARSEALSLLIMDEAAFIPRADDL